MDLVRKEICDFIEDSEKYTFKEVALIIGCQPQLLSNFKKGKNISFRNLLKMSFVMRGNNFDILINKWATSLTSAENVKHAFEYAALTRNVSLLSDLLKVHRKSDGIIRECVALYSVILDYIQDRFPWTELYARISEIKNITDKTLQILVDIFKIYGHYHNKKYLLMLESVEELQCNINALSDKREGFLKECFYVRLAEVYAPAFFHLNNLEQSRYFANLLISTEISAKIMSDGYYYMGMSLLLENETECLEYLQKSIDILEDHHNSLSIHALSNLNFARSFYAMPLLNEEKDKFIRIFNLIKRGLNVSDEELDELKREGNSTFKKYYLALAENSFTGLTEVFTEFAGEKNLFFANVIATELRKMNSNLLMVDALLKISFNSEGVSFIEKNIISCFGDFKSVRYACS